MSRTQKILFFTTGWLIVLMPFLFWWSTWFGRHLTDQQLTEYLHDDKKPRHIQHALVQMGERMGAPNQSQTTSSRETVKRWYPDLLRLANYPVEEVRNTDAWVMGQDTFGSGLSRNAAEDAGRPFANGAWKRRSIAGTFRRRHRPSADRSVVATGDDQRSRRWSCSRRRPPRHSRSSRWIDWRSWRLRARPRHSRFVLRSPDASARLRRPGANVAAGAEIAVVDPGTDQVWEALRALYLVGQMDDVSAIRPYERDVPDIPDHVRQQAAETEKAIRTRAGRIDRRDRFQIDDFRLMIDDF